MRCWWDYNNIGYLTLLLNSIRYINQVIDKHVVYTIHYLIKLIFFD